MDAETLLSLANQALILTITLAAPILGVGLVTALIVGFIQSLFQIQDQTIAVIVRLFAMLFAVVAFLPWIINSLLDFSRTVWGPGL